MKKSRRILLLCGVFLILLCFVGCTQSSVEESDSVSTESQTASTDGVISDLSSDSETDSATPSTDVKNVLPSNPQYVYDTFDGSHLADEVLYENSTYRLERIDGKCYLSFHRLPEELVSSGCVVHSPYVYLNSADELFLRFTGMALDSYSLQQIRTFFTPDEQGRYRMVDPYNFRVPTVPSMEVSSVNFGASEMYYWLRLSEKSSENTSLRFDLISESTYEREVASFQKAVSESQDKVLSHEDDRNATVSQRKNEIRKYYILQNEEKTIYVTESYWLNTEQYEQGIPIGVIGVGTDGTSFFYFKLGQMSARPTVEWLLSIETAPYVPKR